MAALATEADRAGLDFLETYRDLASGMLDVYLSSISNRMNEVMKVLTMIATIFIPLSFLAGLYGMNFDTMPELHIPWAYPALLTVLAEAVQRGRRIETLAAAVGEDKGTLEEVVEPFLIHQGFLDRTPRGRVATARAVDHWGGRSRQPGLF